MTLMTKPSPASERTIRRLAMGRVVLVARSPVIPVRLMASEVIFE